MTFSKVLTEELCVVNVLRSGISREAVGAKRLLRLVIFMSMGPVVETKNSANQHTAPSADAKAVEGQVDWGTWNQSLTLHQNAFLHLQRSMRRTDDGTDPADLELSKEAGS